ncbi:MAG: hypothetical protein ACRYFS_24115 [Janthinobacterium lividum]
MPATFADISWGSSITSAVAQIRSKDFTVLHKDSILIRAEGKIFGKVSKINLNFDQMNLYKVEVYIGVTVAHAVFEYERIASILSQKYGSPILEEIDGAAWRNASTCGTEIILTLTPSHEQIGIVYTSPELTVSEDDLEASKDLF